MQFKLLKLFLFLKLTTLGFAQNDYLVKIPTFFSFTFMMVPDLQLVKSNILTLYIVLFFYSIETDYFNLT